MKGLGQYPPVPIPLVLGRVVLGDKRVLGNVVHEGVGHGSRLRGYVELGKMVLETVVLGRMELGIVVLGKASSFSPFAPLTPFDIRKSK